MQIPWILILQGIKMPKAVFLPKALHYSRDRLLWILVNSMKTLSHLLQTRYKSDMIHLLLSLSSGWSLYKESTLCFLNEHDRQVFMCESKSRTNVHSINT